jgi:hypothetical protein
MKSIYYTYAYLREDGTPYYIGKGKGKRAYDRRRHSAYVPSKNRILFLKKNLTEEEAFKHEIYMIAIFGRKDLETGILYNLTDGGDGPSGYVYTEEQRKKMGDMRRGKKRPKHSEIMKKKSHLQIINQNKQKELREKYPPEKIAMLYTEGKTLKEIKLILGCGMVWIRKSLDEMNVCIRHRNDYGNPMENPEVRDKVSQKAKERGAWYGENNPNYGEGICRDKIIQRTKEVNTGKRKSHTLT